jgi:ATP/maltotriose-dependent transcriptional regulator MalT
MSNVLVNELDVIAKNFVRAVVAAMRKASLKDILEAGEPRQVPIQEWIASAEADLGKRAPSKRGNPSAKLAAVNAIVAYVKAHPGQAGEVVRKAVGLDRNKWSPALRHAVAARLVTRKGEKRPAKYWAT